VLTAALPANGNFYPVRPPSITPHQVVTLDNTGLPIWTASGTAPLHRTKLRVDTRAQTATIVLADPTLRPGETSL